MYPNATRSYWKLGLILLIFFIISFFTNILGALNPSVSSSYYLSETLAGFLPFAFFIAYGLMSIPAGMLVERYSIKKMLAFAFGISMLGAVLFVAFPNFSIYLISLFTIGAGFAMMQVILNPWLRRVGGEEHYAFNSVLAQLVFGGASFVSPKLYTWVVSNVHQGNREEGPILLLNAITPPTLSWVALYGIFAMVCLLLMGIIALVRIAPLELRSDEKSGTWDTYRELFQNPTVLLFFLGIFAYVGSEQGISYWMSKFLADYHGVDYETVGANAVANYWGLMTLGGVLGLVLLKLLDSKLVLGVFTSITLCAFLLGLLGSRSLALLALPSTGFFMSVMFPIVISLALNSLDKHHGAFAGILMTGIMGGAVMQVLIGGLADGVGLRWAMLLNLLPLAYILSISFWAKPLVRNKTLGMLGSEAQG